MSTSKICEFQGTNRWLSNFWPCDVEYEGKKYPSVEHAYQAAKTLNEVDREKIRLAESPGRAKRLGKKVDVRGDWEKIKLPVMENLVFQKFENVKLRNLLLATGDLVLEEGNRWGDTFWGVDLQTGEGENYLGKILMKVRNYARP